MTATQIVGGLYIGDIQDIRERDTSNFDHIVGVCQDDCSENVGCTYSHYNLRDGPYDPRGRGNFKKEILFDAIDDVVRARLQRKTVCVHCHAGQSRSATTTIAALAVLEGLSWEDARKKVERKRNIHPNTRLVEWGKEYVEDHQ